MRAEQNEFLSRTGPGTAMGELFRRYWLPALLAEELPEPDCPPVRVRMLGERLIAFRDTQGRLGLVDEYCLHRHTMKVGPMFKAATQSHKYNLGDLAPYFEVVESPGGLYIGARRNADNDKYYWRITQWIMPSFTLIPPRGDHPIGGHCWVPMDDENCWAWSTNHHATRPLSKEERDAMEAGKGIHVPAIPGTFRPVATKDNDYLMDRKAQKDGRSFSGIDGFAMQDASVQESMGPIQDRTRENLVPTDQGIIMARRRLIKAAQELDKGIQPPGVDPRHTGVRSASVLLPKS